MFRKPMALAVLAALSGAAGAADDAELAAIRSQIAELKKSYEQRIAALEDKLAQTRAAAAAPAGPAPAAPTVAAASAFNPEVSLILQGQYKSMKNIAERGVTGFWPAAGHDHEEGGIKGISRRGFSVEHTELMLGANIDPYWRGQATLAVADGEVEVEEAWFQSLGIGHGIGLKGGRFRSGIGYLNEQHAHAWDFADAPLMYAALFGEHASYAQDGLQLKWLAPTPMLVEFGAEFGRGANFPGTDRNKNGAGAAAFHVHLGDDVGTASSWRAGLSYLRTRAREREAEVHDANDVHGDALFTGRSRTWIADFVWKWSPDGNPKYRNLKLQGEYFDRRENGDIACTSAEAGAACSGALDRYRSSQSGWYAQAVYQFTPNWRAGVRYDRLNSGSTRIGAAAQAEIGDENAIFHKYRPSRGTLMVDYSWSEFSRLRLQYARDKSMAGIADNQFTVQYIMSLGAHGAHKF
ncbi:hypothetical protein DFR40_2166 [Azonexus fungiphilus]|uniref:TonB-dependent receptor n=1 Tax=Azonexus fungiphilus TaxID=146940 RepID=A0A495W951_9RHOO|nr:TonB-dependent receptor [Azonexus fungiphilus]RKT58222.1 hypothetical protein DFR40_2166 [Azonexus fungiphilus]